MESQMIKLSDLRKVSGIGNKTIERIKNMLLEEFSGKYISEYDEGLHLDINKIHLGDCLELMNGIPDKSVDMILCDLPYGITRNAWDSIIPFDKLWMQYERVIKDNGAIVLFGSEPFTSNLIASNKEIFKYEWIWKKIKGVTGHLNAKKVPMKEHENIAVFYKNAPTYNCLGLIEVNKMVERTNRGNYGECSTTTLQTHTGYPRSILEYQVVPSIHKLHTTEKPVKLVEYLIETYTNTGETVLDNCIGSGTTAIAAMNTGRNYIGIELDESYYDIAKERVDEFKNGLSSGLQNQ